MSVASEATMPAHGRAGGTRSDSIGAGNGHERSGTQEFITPAKICVALLLRNYVLMIKNPEDDEDEEDDEEEEMRARDPETAKMNVEERKNFCLMTIALIQGVDRSLKQLIDAIHNDFGFVTQGYQNASAGLWRAWARDMKVVCVEEGVGGLMDLSFSLEKMVSAEVQVPHLHRASVVGRFLRRIVIFFERLNFSEVANLHADFQRYYEAGKPSLTEATSMAATVPSQVTPSVTDTPERLSKDTPPPPPELDVSAEIAHINNLEKVSAALSEHKSATAVTSDGLLNIADIGKVSRQQAELYISSQVELLQKAECHAQSPEQIHYAVQRILEDNPDLIEAYFLDFLNCLRAREYCGAMQAIHKWLVIRAEAGGSAFMPDTDVPKEEVDKGFLHAALNLGALYARFQHKSQAFAALKEAVMMAQEANDQACLQHALAWLYRLQPETRPGRIALIERCITKCNDTEMSYLTSLGIQTLAQSAAVSGRHPPKDVIEILGRSDVLNCQHSIVELVTTSYAQKSSLWDLYGKVQMSCVVSQLLLNLDTSERARDGGIFFTAEASALALCTLAKYLQDNGCSKACDKILGLSKKLFPNEASVSGQLWSFTKLQVDYERALMLADWKSAEELSSTSESCAPHGHKFEPALMRLKLKLAQGDKDTSRKLLITIKKRWWEEMSPSHRVRLLLMQVEQVCLTEVYPDAIPCLMEAKEICIRHYLDFLGACVNLHLAHVQFQLGFTDKGLRSLLRCLPHILAHGGLFETCRAKVLLAKILVANSQQLSGDGSNKKRSDLHQSIGLLRQAADGYAQLKAHSRTRDALYIIARLYHHLDMIEQRNMAAAEWKSNQLQHPSDAANPLVIAVTL